MTDLTPKIILQENKDNYSRFAIEPLDQGMGQTLGNAFRRTLLSSLAGAAITKVKISGASHQFSVLSGVKEDTVDLILNLKKVNFLMTKKVTTIVTLEKVGPGEVKAGDLQCPTGIEVANKDLEIAHLADKKTTLQMEVTIEYGKGYRLAQEGLGVGVIAVDAGFSPVERVNFKVEEARVGRLSNFDRLILEIWSNGTIEPKEGLKQAAAILEEQFAKIAQGTLVERVENPLLSNIATTAVPTAEQHKEEVYLEELGFPTRTINALKSAGIETVSAVLAKGEEELSKIKHIGPKTVELIMKKIKKTKD